MTDEKLITIHSHAFSHYREIFGFHLVLCHMVFTLQRINLKNDATMGGKASKVFLSYAKRDSDAVEKVGRQLQQAGFPIWDSDKEILAGSDWTTELKTALDSAASLVVLFRPRRWNRAL